MSTALTSEAEAIGEQLTCWRRRLHAQPELSGREEGTARFIADELKKIGLTPIERVGGTHGVLADFPAAAGPAVALRADFDALPIQEETGVDYASTVEGVMHACGHDAHVAMLLGAATILQARKSDLKRPVRLIFQPHEEYYPGGASAMIADDALDGVGEIFGLHVWSGLPIGVVGARSGPFMAAVNPFEIAIIGRGGHAAIPHECVDPVIAAAHVVTALQTIVSRSTPFHEPAVVSVTQINGGSADNVIPGRVDLAGTIRTLSEETRASVCRRTEELASRVAASFGARAEVMVKPGYPVLVNDAIVTERALRVARSIGFDEQHIQTMAPIGGGEDFAYFCERVPGAFVFVGAGNKEKDCSFPHHHPRFNLDEDVLPLGAALHAGVALAAPVS